MKQKTDFLVRIALVLLLLLGVSVQANAGSDQTLRKNGSVVGRIESNGDVRIGGTIKGAHIDIWFPSHKAAIAWGTRKIKVKVERADTL